MCHHHVVASPPLLGSVVAPFVLAVVAAAPSSLPANRPFDYQIGEPYEPRAGVEVVSRDWFDGEALADGYSICYVNAFQTQPDSGAVDRPDERSNWPDELVLGALGDDPEWGGEYLVDISTETSRRAAADWLAPMFHTCADKGFDAVELDNLDSWTRFDDTPLAGQVPFGAHEAAAFASLLTADIHALGLAAGQKNTVDLLDQAPTIGFDFGVVEECGEYDECGDFAATYGGDFVAIEYGDEGFAAACASVGDLVSVVRRDVDVTAPGSDTYVHDEC